MARRAGVFTAEGHVNCARCGHPRYRHVWREWLGCSALMYTPAADGTPANTNWPRRCDCPGYQPPKGS